MEEIHHGDSGGVLQPAEQSCVALPLPLETTLSVSQSFTQALLTYGDHTEQLVVILPQERTL